MILKRFCKIFIVISQLIFNMLKTANSEVYYGMPSTASCGYKIVYD